MKKNLSLLVVLFLVTANRPADAKAGRQAVSPAERGIGQERKK